MQLLPCDTARNFNRRLALLYGEAQAPALMERFLMTLGRYGLMTNNQWLHKTDLKPRWAHGDVVLITYADSIQTQGEPPLRTFRRFAREHLRGLFSTLHFLPFYPWSSDDGFSVIDYRKVEASYGDWQDVAAVGKDFSLMFDLVLNHCSARSQWFRDFITGIAPYNKYFHCIDPATDLSAVVRPRPWPLLTKTATHNGDAWVWTTFSEDQVDLNWANPDVLFEFLDILLFYLSRGARMLRLDAVAFLWKEVGTDCIHLPQTHEVIKLLRDVVEAVAPETILITETNVPHQENISYFGEGDEAHVVYNFTLPPLLLHGLLRNDCTELRTWAQGLPVLPKGQTFLNFTASHDGIGVRPLQGIVTDKERDWLVKQVKARGGKVSMRSLSDGSQLPYELNITYCDALSDPEDSELGVRRFLCSQALMLAFRGIPAVYIHSLLGTPNDLTGYKRTGQNRSINRRKWQEAELIEALQRRDDRMGRIFAKYSQWLKRRVHQPAFHPEAEQTILNLGPAVFGIIRHCPQQTIVGLFNFTPQNQAVDLHKLDPRLKGVSHYRDILNASQHSGGPRNQYKLQPYEAAWLTPSTSN